MAVQKFLCPTADKKKSALSTILDSEILQGHGVFLQRMMFDQQKINPYVLTKGAFLWGDLDQDQ